MHLYTCITYFYACVCTGAKHSLSSPEAHFSLSITQGLICEAHIRQLQRSLLMAGTQRQSQPPIHAFDKIFSNVCHPKEGLISFIPHTIN